MPGRLRSFCRGRTGVRSVTKRAERRREHRSESRDPSKSRIPWVVGGVFLLGIGIVGWNLVSSIFDDTVRAPVEVTYGSLQELVTLAQGVEEGNPDASVTILEFGDYQCPSCQAFFQQVEPFLDLTYIQNNQVSFVFYDFPLVDAHPNAFIAARAARCAGDQDSYWALHDKLYQTQLEWSLLADPSGEFEGYAEVLGLDEAAFESCLGSDRHAALVSANILLGNALGVQGTPTVMVDTGEGRAVQISDYSMESIRAVVDAALARQAAPAAEPTP
ncbi:MAG: hypothetical protein EXR92_00640 [Gemmatimonadetes bacterium]|nr:hypothetical protein [Gemmatimonadota bacterium]